MAELQRYTQKIFAENSTQLGQFGSAIDNTKVISSDVEVLQGLQAYLDGWSSAVITNKNYPTWQEMDGVLYGITYQQAYMFQNGIPEYDDGTEYKIGSIVKKTGTFELYGSLTNGNVGNSLSDTTYWKLLIDLENLGDFANQDLSNLTTTGKGYASGLGMPSSRKIDLTLGSSGTYYVAPANGWVVFGKTSSGAGQYMSIGGRSYGVALAIRSQGSNQLVRGFFPVQKNQEYGIAYTLGGATDQFSFIYAEGEE